ncbi:MAG: L-seryl-tRNA(Sec) selenium transferase [Betaproteobacteria bacterium]
MNKRSEASERLAAIPSVDRLLQQETLRAAAAIHGHATVVDAVREVLSAQREALKAASAAPGSAEGLVAAVLDRIEARSRPSLRRVFNLTGTVLHTNLGRALLPVAAADAAKQALVAPCNLEFDLGEGERGERDAHLEGLVCRLTGAEAATIVNNNAAGVLLALSSLAFGKEVPVSRGELVEIGGAFRIPEVIESAGCRLRELGTTNRTHLRDYERALGPDTAAVLKVHTSNYAIVGFAASVAEAELAALAHAKGLPFITDLGSGSLVDMTALGLPAERTPMESLRDGADLVCFSGDKLLGGVQAGFVVGRRDLVDRLRRNPLKRALRLDKARIAALEAVLRLYADPDRARKSIPTLRLLTRPLGEIEETARRLLPVVQAWCGAAATADIAACASQVGSGSLPVDRLPSAALRIRPAQARGVGTALARISQALRALPVPVVGRVHEDALWLDLRCLDDPADEALFLDQLRKSSL